MVTRPELVHHLLYCLHENLKCIIGKISTAISRDLHVQTINFRASFKGLDESLEICKVKMSPVLRVRLLQKDECYVED